MAVQWRCQGSCAVGGGAPLLREGARRRRRRRRRRRSWEAHVTYCTRLTARDELHETHCTRRTARHGAARDLLHETVQHEAHGRRPPTPRYPHGRCTSCPELGHGHGHVCVHVCLSWARARDRRLVGELKTRQYALQRPDVGAPEGTILRLRASGGGEGERAPRRQRGVNAPHPSALYSESVAWR